MNIVYQIKSDDITAYASNIVACDELCAKIIDGGGSVRVRRMKKSMVPMSDLELVNTLKEL